MDRHARRADRESPVVADRVPVQDVASGPKPNSSVNGVADDVVVVATRERDIPRPDSKLRITGPASLLIAGRRSVLGQFENFHSDPVVRRPFSRVSLVPTSFIVDRQVAGKAVLEIRP